MLALGYGVSGLLTDSENMQFVNIPGRTKTLSKAQKDELAQSFYEERAIQAKAGRRIRVITHTATALINLSSALTTSNNELQIALFFLSGINALAAGHFALSSSHEEEKFEEIKQRSKITLMPSYGLNWVATNLTFNL